MATSSDFQEKDSSKDMETKSIEEGIDALEFSGKTMIPNARKLRDMGQSFTSAIGQLTNFSRSSTIESIFLKQRQACHSSLWPLQV